MCGKSNNTFHQKNDFHFSRKKSLSIDKLQAPPIKCPDVVEIG